MFKKQTSDSVLMTNGHPPVGYKFPARISWGSKIDIGSNRDSSLIPIPDQEEEESMSKIMKSEYIDQNGIDGKDQALTELSSFTKLQSNQMAKSSDRPPT